MGATGARLVASSLTYANLPQPAAPHPTPAATEIQNVKVWPLGTPSSLMRSSPVCRPRAAVIRAPRGATLGHTALGPTRAGTGGFEKKVASAQSAGSKKVA